ncbi:sigma-54-dependent Fis family transcriptional regulator, partial [Candidatus Desantisbacteria bacterium]|nr:sigma-54-dependent Fis family transcriptional regulator [Candidatus Desantisbacteria bacterium]
MSYEEIKEKIVELVFDNFEADLCELYLGTEENISEFKCYGEVNCVRRAGQPQGMPLPVYNVMKSRIPIRFENEAEKEFGEDYSEYNSTLVFPLMSAIDRKPFGVMVLYALKANTFSIDDEEYFRILSLHIAQFLKNVRFYEESQHRLDELEALSRIGKELNASYDLPGLLYKIVNLTAELMKVSGVILRLKDEQEDVLRIKSYYGITDEIAHTVTQKIGEGIAGKVAEDGKAIISNDAASDPFYSQNISLNIRSVLCVPLLMKGNVIGTMSVYDKKINGEWQAFNEDDERLLETIASQASIAIENARIFSDRTAKVSAKEDLVKAGDFAGESHQVEQIRAAIDKFAANLRPVLLTGEPGTGKRLASKQIHLESPNRDGPYIEVDVRRFDPQLWGGELFGYGKDHFSFAPVRRLGYLEQFKRGTIVLSHIEELEKSLQIRLLNAIKNGHFETLDGKRKIILSVRLIFLLDGNAKFLVGAGSFNRDFYNVLAEQSFDLPPLRNRKRDIPALAQHYL